MNLKYFHKICTAIVIWLQHFQVWGKGCKAPLGLESGEIKDSQITAPHWLYGKTHYTAKNVRLNLKSTSGSWCSENIETVENQYVQIDLLKNKKVTGIATQGRDGNPEYVERYQIQYQRDGEDSFRKYSEKNDWVEFKGNEDAAKINHNNFKRPIIARKVRIFPRGDEFSIYCMRLELYGCEWQHEKASVLKYTAPYGAEKKGVDLQDNTYDGNRSSNIVFNGLGKLTDDIYGSKNNVAGGITSPWVAYNSKNPEMKFEFQSKKHINQIMVYVLNSQQDVKIFKKVNILISSDDKNYQKIKEYTADEKQRNKIDAYSVVIDIGMIAAKYLKLKFTKDGDWLMISEIVFITEHPSTEVVPPPIFPSQSEKPKTTQIAQTVENDESNSLSFPIILTIALGVVVIVAAVGIIAYKSCKKNRKGESLRYSPTPQSQQQMLPATHKSEMQLYDEQMFHAKQQQQQQMQQQAIIQHNGMYMQPILSNSTNPYNVQLMLS